MPRRIPVGSARRAGQQAAEKGPAARRRPKAAREPYSLYGERAAEGANEADGPLSAACQLFGESVKSIHRDKQIPRVAELSKPAAIDRHDLARPVQAREHPVDGQPERSIASLEHEAVRLVGQILLGD